MLERRHAQVVATPAGTRLLELGKTILQTCNAAKEEMKTIGHRRRLRIGVLPPLPSGPLSKLLNSFQQANPGIEVEVADGHCDGWCHCEQTFGPLAEGDRDAVISIVNESVASKYASRALFNFPYMLTVRSDHRFAEQRSVTIGDLVNESLILPQRCTFLQDVTNALTSLGRAARIIYRTDHDDWALELVAAGLGLAFVPGFFKISTIKQVPVSGLGISRTVGLVWQRERENDDLKKFAAFAENHGWAQ